MVDRHYKKVLVATMRITTNTTPKTTTGGQSEYWLNHLVVVIAAGKRPASIPNLEAKPASADGTAPGRVWESRTPPQHTSRWGPLEHTRSKGPTTLRIPTRKATGGQPARPVKRPQGCLFAYAPLVTTSTCQHMPRCEQTPRIRTQHRKARAWRVIAPSAHTSANTHT